MNKHTPGPWRIIERPESTVWIQGQQDENGYREVCTLPNYLLLQREKTEANARLIAAAPELLEALKACVHAMDSATRFDGNTRPFDDARAAIAKATGGSNE